MKDNSPCYSERSEEAGSQRCFASLNMTDTMIEKSAAERNAKMKRLLRIIELSVNEQRVVVIIMLILITIAVVAYERRINRSPIGSALTPKLKPSATPAETARDQ